VPKRETEKNAEKINCPKCGHHKAWVLPYKANRCTKCGFRFTIEKEEQSKNLLGFLKKSK